jgi:hypothetical protein
MNVARKAGMVAALVALSAFTGGLPATVSAHHGGAIEWGQEVRGPLAGTATKFAFQFPHVYISVDVADGGGAVAKWTLVTRWTPTVLREHGWSRDSVKPGDAIAVTYLPHVEAPLIGQMISVAVNGQPLDLNF